MVLPWVRVSRWQVFRAVITTAYALTLSAYLTLGDLSSPDGSSPNTTRFMVVAGLGIALLVLMARQHALWVLPAAIITFAIVHVTWFFDGPTGGGMDSIGQDPTWGAIAAVVYGLSFAMLLVLTSLLIQSLWAKRRSRADSDR